MFKTRFFALALLCSAMAPAQLMRVMVANVKPDRVEEFRDLQKKATAAWEKAGKAFRLVYAPGELGPQSTFYAFTPMDKFAEFDKPAVPAAMGEKEYQAFLARAADCLTDVHYEVVERRPALTVDEGPRPMGLYQVVQMQVKIGHEDAFEAKMKELVEAARKAGSKTILASRVLWGGPIGMYRFGIPVANFAELDKTPLGVRALGKEGYAAWRKALAEHVESVEYRAVRVDTALSFRK